MTKEKNENVEEILEENTEETQEEIKEDVKEENKADEAEKEIASLKEKLLRHAAEFDNYKKRTQKEHEELYKTAVCDTILKILPVKDNLERALGLLDGADEKVLDGIKMIDKQFSDVLKEAGVEPIKSIGETFNPDRHNAVMHEEADDSEKNVITEEFMKGYIYKDEKVIRYSMVKVKN